LLGEILFVFIKIYEAYFFTYGSGVGGFGLVTSFSIFLTGLISLLGEGLGDDGGDVGSGLGDGVGGGVGEFTSGSGSGDWISLNARFNWSEKRLTLAGGFFGEGCSSGDVGSRCCEGQTRKLKVNSKYFNLFVTLKTFS
jgi:hypothetical protein